MSDIPTKIYFHILEGRSVKVNKSRCKTSYLKFSDCSSLDACPIYFHVYIEK